MHLSSVFAAAVFLLALFQDVLPFWRARMARFFLVLRSCPRITLLDTKAMVLWTFFDSGLARTVMSLYPLLHPEEPCYSHCFATDDEWILLSCT